MNTFFQQITVIAVLVIVGMILVSVASGEDKMKKFVKALKTKKYILSVKGEERTSKSVFREGTSKRVTTVVRRKEATGEIGHNGDWYIMVRDKSNRYTIKKVNFSISQLIDRPFRIGYADECDLRINNEYVGNNHAMIIYDDESENLVFIDDNSRNGSYVNSCYDENGNYCEGEKIETAEITDGLTVYLWDTPIVFSKSPNMSVRKSGSVPTGEAKCSVGNTREYRI